MFLTNTGTFTLDQKRCNVPCLFYATFNNKICVHYNVRLKEIGTSNLFDAVQQLCSATGVECPGKGIVAALFSFCVHECMHEVVSLTIHFRIVFKISRFACGLKTIL